LPELPEVETVVRGLRPYLEGARIDRVTLKRKDLRFPFPRGFAKALEGQTITSVGRRAKYLLFRLSGTEPVARLYAEACTPKELKNLLDAGKRFVA